MAIDLGLKRINQSPCKIFSSVNDNGTRRISSTPLLDIISRFPLLAGRIFYKLMTVDTKNGEMDDKISFEDFDVAIINQVRVSRKKCLDKAKRYWWINSCTS